MTQSGPFRIPTDLLRPKSVGGALLGSGPAARGDDRVKWSGGCVWPTIEKMVKGLYPPPRNPPHAVPVDVVDEPQKQKGRSMRATPVECTKVNLLFKCGVSPPGATGRSPLGPAPEHFSSAGGAICH